MKLSRYSPVALLCLAAFMAIGTPVPADTFTYAWASTGEFGFGTGSGTLTAVTDTGIPNALDITSFSGTVNGGPIIGLLPCSTYDPNQPCDTVDHAFFYDNLLYPDGVPPLNILRISVGLDLGSGIEGSFYASSTHLTSFITNLPHDNGHVVAFSITPIPEPGSFVLLGTGLLGVIGTVRRRLKS